MRGYDHRNTNKLTSSSQLSLDPNRWLKHYQDPVYNDSEDLNEGDQLQYSSEFVFWSKRYL